MRVFLDVSSVKQPLTGIGRYAFELARHLPFVDQGLELQLISGGHRLNGLPSLSNGVSDNKATALKGRTAGALKSAVASSGALVKLYQRAICYRQTRLLQNESGVFHGPQFRLPRLTMPSVVTIHDMSVYSWAQCHPPARVSAMRKATEDAVGRAAHIITDSEFARQEIKQHFSLSGDCITATPLACSELFHARDAAETLPVLKKFCLEHAGYAFFSGTIEPRKNISTLIDAYERLPLKLRRMFPLVLCGFHGWRSGDIHIRIERAQAEGWLKYLGYVDESELPVLFAGARVFVFPSLYEGFGLPVLEAMASGTPVICSNRASLPEVAGDAAALFDALDVDTLTELLRRGLEDSAWRSRAHAAGLQQAALFSWQRCASKTAHIYRAAFSREEP